MTRAPSAWLLFAGFLLAGCATTHDEEGGDDGNGDVRSPYALDCTIFPGAGGASWPQPCVALASANDSPSKAEVDIAVNPTDPKNIVVASKDKDPLASNDCVWSVAQVTHDGGKTWATVYVGGTKADREPILAAYECVTDPMLTFGEDGVLYYALQAYDNPPRNPPQIPVVGTPDTGSAFILARSTDGGDSFTHYALQAPGVGDFLLHDYPRMIENPATGSIHTIWNAYAFVPPFFGNVLPVVSSTRDGGETVDPPLVLHREDPSAPLGFFSGFAARKDGTIFVTMQKDENSDAGQPTKVWVWRSTDDAASFEEVGEAFEIHPTPRQHGNHSFRTPSFVEMAVDATNGNHSGRIYLFWTEWIDEQSDVLCSWSDDSETWSAPVQVASRRSGGQYFMRPHVGPDGTVHVMFTSQAYSGTELLDQVHAWSKDGGARWEDQRLTNVSFDGDKGIHQDNFPFIGDYNGLEAGPDGVVHAAWGDTATGRAEVAYARIVPTP